jgi:hypothetical protein
VIELEQGRLIITNFCAELQRNGKNVEVWTQRDFDIGYNAAPDYTGGGFSVEHRNFLAAIRQSNGEQQVSEPRSNAVHIEEAAALEKLIFSIYEKASASRPSWLQAQESEFDAEMDRLIGMGAPHAAA